MNNSPSHNLPSVPSRSIQQGHPERLKSLQHSKPPHAKSTQGCLDHSSKTDMIRLNQTPISIYKYISIKSQQLNVNVTVLQALLIFMDPGVKRWAKLLTSSFPHLASYLACSLVQSHEFICFDWNKRWWLIDRFEAGPLSIASSNLSRISGRYGGKRRRFMRILRSSWLVGLAKWMKGIEACTCWKPWSLSDEKPCPAAPLGSRHLNQGYQNSGPDR